MEQFIRLRVSHHLNPNIEQDVMVTVNFSSIQAIWTAFRKENTQVHHYLKLNKPIGDLGDTLIIGQRAFSRIKRIIAAQTEIMKQRVPETVQKATYITKADREATADTNTATTENN